MRHLQVGVKCSTSTTLPKLNLLNTSPQRPNINGTIDQYGDNIGDSPALFGWSGSEYAGFLNLGMYNAGKNIIANALRIGTAFVAYDCTTNTLCVAAYLNGTNIFGDDAYNCTINQSNASTWVQIATSNKGTDTTKYKEGDANNLAFKYVKFPDSNFTGGLRPMVSDDIIKVAICGGLTFFL